METTLASVVAPRALKKPRAASRNHPVPTAPDPLRLPPLVLADQNDVAICAPVAWLAGVALLLVALCCAHALLVRS